MSNRNERILKHFPPKNSWEENYKKIIELGRKLPKFNETDKEEKWMIKACQSPLWLKVTSDNRGYLIFTGDSDGLISKGLLALIIEFYSHRTARDILRDQPVFVKKLELEQYLSSRRTNGLQSILDQILQYARAFSIILKDFKSESIQKS